jgi:hypothetical protein
METKMTIYAEALADNRNYKNARIDGKSVGVAEYRAWGNAVKALRYPAYAIRQYRHANLGNAETVAPCDMGALYSALHTVLDLVGVVNGAKLDAKNCAEEIISQASRIRTIDTTPEMAHARLEKRNAKKAMDEDDNEDTRKAYESASAEVERLESEPNNCKKIIEIQTETAFIKAVEILLGDAITKQTMKTLEEVLAEEEAKRQARRAKTAAKKAAKKANA